MSHIGLKKAARIRAIYAACRAQGIDDDTRHDLQRAITGRASLSEMNLQEVTQVLEHLNKRGPAKRPALTPVQKKMWSLWQQLADAGLVEDRKMPALLAYISRQTGIEAQGALNWMNAAQEKSVVEALKRWLTRREMPSAEEKADA